MPSIGSVSKELALARYRPYLTSMPSQGKGKPQYIVAWWRQPIGEGWDP